MTELSETRAVQDLKELAKRNDRASQQRAVDHLLSLNGQKPQQQPEHENPLVAQVLRNVRR